MRWVLIHVEHTELVPARDDRPSMAPIARGHVGAHGVSGQDALHWPARDASPRCPVHVPGVSRKLNLLTARHLPEEHLKVPGVALHHGAVLGPVYVPDVARVTLRDPHASVLLAHVVHVDVIIVRTHAQVLTVRRVLELVYGLLPVLLGVYGVQTIRAENHEPAARETDGNLRSIRVIRDAPSLCAQIADHDHPSAGDVPHAHGAVVAHGAHLMLPRVRGEPPHGSVPVTLEHQRVRVRGGVHLVNLASAGPEDEHAP
mmetsp:Transcript_10957/g.49551  ORF Transcript_10957/g.49551 Transcript_10957/m.49551 type:complete len:258 (-) Transcript_10957:3410-4183(-)